MLAVGDRVVDTQASYRDEVSEVWYANSEGTLIYQLRPEVVLSGTAIARRDGVIEKGLESLGYRKGWNAARGGKPDSAPSRSGPSRCSTRPACAAAPIPWSSIPNWGACSS